MSCVLYFNIFQIFVLYFYYYYILLVFIESITPMFFGDKRDNLTSVGLKSQ